MDERTAQSAELDDATQMYYYGARYGVYAEPDEVTQELVYL
ncbi:hypothetical protein P3875_08700 [Myroides sp. JBRI-B21084]|nr:hypothetical protein [Paenimyroides cloacae]WKW45856.1 hypothetical protein P3875_08700 [Paenimyroides cloacae]